MLYNNDCAVQMYISLSLQKQELVLLEESLAGTILMHDSSKGP